MLCRLLRYTHGLVLLLFPFFNAVFGSGTPVAYSAKVVMQLLMQE